MPCEVTYPREGWTNTIPHLEWTDSDPALGYWFPEGANVLWDTPVATNDPDRSVQGETWGRFHLLEDLKRHNCSLDIRDAWSGDKGTYFFRVEKGHMKWVYKFPRLSVHVTALTQTPGIQIPGTLESGRPSSLTCTVPWACERGMPPAFSWTSAALPSLGPSTRLSSVLTLTPRPQDHGTTLTCQVNFPGVGVTVERPVQLNVSYPPQSLTIAVVLGKGTAPMVLGNGSSLPAQEGQSLRLICVANSNPPTRLSWAQGSLTLSPSHPSDLGVLELPRVHAGDEGGFTCWAENPLGAQHTSVSLSLQGRAWSGVLLGAVGGAGTTALLFSLFCLIFFRMEPCRKKAAGPAVGVEDANTITESVSKDHLTESQADALPCPPSPAVAAPSPGGEDLHYASLNFQGVNSRHPQGQEATSSEYSEIAIHK